MTHNLAFSGTHTFQSCLFFFTKTFLVLTFFFFFLVFCVPKVILFFFLILFLAVLSLHCCTQAFSSCGEWGATLRCSAPASHCGGFSCCRAQALGTQPSVVVARGLSSCGSWILDRRLSSCGGQA